VFRRTKYNTPASTGLKAFAWAQLVLNNLLLYHLLTSIAKLEEEPLAVLVYALFIALSIFAYTSLMDRHPLAVLMEGIKLLLGLGWMLQMGNWFGLETLLPGGMIWVGVYVAISMGLTVYFTYFERSFQRSQA
jgi:alkylglycerol monooxygenase